jgi:TPR repeat protein
MNKSCTFLLSACVCGLMIAGCQTGGKSAGNAMPDDVLTKVGQLLSSWDTLINSTPPTVFREHFQKHVEGQFIYRSVRGLSSDIGYTPSPKVLEALLAAGTLCSPKVGTRAQLEAKALSGDASAMAFLGGVLIGEGKTKEAVDYIKRAAELGNGQAQYNLGSFYFAGAPGLEKNAATAVKWFEKAFASGNAEAAMTLGVCYKNGEGVVKDVSQAIRYFKLAADQGNPRAIHNLGNRFIAGDGVDKDCANGIALLKRSAGMGLAKSQYVLATHFLKGEAGLSKDVGEGMKYLEMAAAQNLTKAMLAIVCINFGDESGQTAEMLLAGPEQFKIILPLLAQMIPKLSEERYAYVNDLLFRLMHLPETYDIAQQMKQRMMIKQLKDVDDKTLCELAARGDTWAQFELAFSSCSPSSGTPADYQQAMKYCAEAAKGGYPKAQLFMLGIYSKDPVGLNAYKDQVVEQLRNALINGYTPGS